MLQLVLHLFLRFEPRAGRGHLYCFCYLSNEVTTRIASFFSLRAENWSRFSFFLVLQNDIDLLNPLVELEKRKHKLKRLVQTPNSFFMNHCLQPLSNCSGMRQLPNRLMPTNRWKGKANRGLLISEEGRLNVHVFESTSSSVCSYDVPILQQIASNHWGVPLLPGMGRVESYKNGRMATEWVEVRVVLTQPEI
ncbi:hypothetical protein Lal_00033281 [Lupinus albus]|nr:hypothetical protein Lal_00033281 [Lupinus albus]